MALKGLFKVSSRGFQGSGGAKTGFRQSFIYSCINWQNKSLWDGGNRASAKSGAEAWAGTWGASSRPLGEIFGRIVPEPESN